MKIMELLGNRQIRLREEPVPEPKPGEALVRITASAICTEAWHYTSAPSPTHHPYNPGHEGVGIVEKINGAGPLKIGQQVNVHGVWSCGVCEYCQAGQFTWCETQLPRPGFHREYVAVPAKMCVPVPEEISPVDAALLTGCTFGLAQGTAKRFGPSQGQTVVIFGLGPVGLAQVAVQAFLGAKPVAIDINDYRLELARQCGAVSTLNPQAPDFEERLTALRAAKVDGGIICVNQPAMVETALRLTRPGGQVLCVAEGLILEQLNVSNLLLRKDLSLRGHWFWFAADLPEILTWYRRGLPIRKVLTHTFPLTNPQEAYETLASGRCGKIVLTNGGR